MGVFAGTSRVTRNEEQEEEEEQEQCGAEAAVGKGHPPQLQPPSETPQNRGAAQEDAPEGPGKGLAAPLPPAPFPSQDLPPANTQPPQPVPAPPGPPREILALMGELEAVREFQSSHRQERKKDLRSCQECLKALKAMREDLQSVQSRLWWVEAKLGMRPPPQEEAEEELGGEGSPPGLGARSFAPPLELDPKG